ncbi:MAG: hypothetical protein A3G93_07095 [Nitrospinae bacterium RIFCSPLOWO2_12_FULL_45_22]|nr:MAG: hypothetical protein A3G93_07095 [Nitrospinae bacterium RIFCSPLOWO2_12_FULL_45_22]
MEHLSMSIAEVMAGLDWSAWVTALATLVLAILTFVYVRLTKKILDAQSDPCVVLTVVHTMWLFSVRNPLIRVAAEIVSTFILQWQRQALQLHLIGIVNPGFRVII